jgi:hypothetical protein
VNFTDNQHPAWPPLHQRDKEAEDSLRQNQHQEAAKERRPSRQPLRSSPDVTRAVIRVKQITEESQRVT